MVSAVPSSASPEGYVEFEGTLASIAERIREQQGRRRKIAEVLAGLRGVDLSGTEGAIESSIVKGVKSSYLIFAILCF